MNHSIQKYLEELKERNQTIETAKESIEQETKKFEKAIAPHKTIIEREKLEIEHIRALETKAELKDIVNEIAKDWNTTADNISTKCFAYFVHTPNNIKTYNGVKDITGHYVLNFSLSCKNGTTCYTAFSTKMNTNTPQVDGNPISKYLAFAGHDSQGSKAKVLSQEDIDKMVLTFKVGDFINSSTNKIKETGCSQALFNACELYTKKHTIKTM
jgi:hypothetical protein